MRNLLRCRRGSAAFATVIALVPLIGVVALGAEAGSWYVTKQHAQNAADSAATSGALTIAIQNAASSAITDAQTYDYRGRQFAAQNAFCNTGDTSYSGSRCAGSLPAGTLQTVQIERGTYSAGSSPSWTTDAGGTSVRATVSQQQPAYLAGVLGLSTVNIGATAIAEVQNPKEMCALGLGPSDNALTIGGSSIITGRGCALMSDTAVKYNSEPTFSGSGWAVNGVSGCKASAGHCDLSVPYNYNMLPAPNPLKALDTATFNARTGNTSPSCPLQPDGWKHCTPNSTGSGAYGSFPTVSNGDQYILEPGTYFFYKADIKVTGGILKGTGVTLVLLGDSGLKITGGTVELSAPAINTFSSLLNGVLIDDQAPTKSSNNVTINGGTTSLGGALYFPNVEVTWGGNVQNANTECTQVIANSLTINGNSYLSTENCAPGTIGKTQVVALVQ
ncbi:pilus assembly protein TadG [Bradyrhizobium sp. AUGA SZCCT0274]|uniref:TadE/TadG family type IV pilus assembly protein n=1 Tax=Bradyrhizobium sp. AUGA SZCCT0274 TaxID=2807670 RepID=UPI001BAB97CB|nr:TadE/TadG family type IV pilus assembly protein [Bradyrhizobium sp. AUGA SZCCT0274]MBR1245119.1 pilus assembly protein TadG [Bradyrhizobium sp. AUGA SZCCT0274]